MTVPATALTIRRLQVADLPDVVELSLRAWAPVFASPRAQLGDAIFLRLRPDWEAGQAEAVRFTCTGMGAVDMTGIDPGYQRRGCRAAADGVRAGPHASRGDGHLPGEARARPAHLRVIGPRAPPVARYFRCCRAARVVLPAGPPLPPVSRSPIPLPALAAHRLRAARACCRNCS